MGEGARERESFRWLTLKVEGRKKNLPNDFIVNSSAIYRREKGDVIAWGARRLCVWTIMCRQLCVWTIMC